MPFALLVAAAVAASAPIAAAPTAAAADPTTAASTAATTPAATPRAVAIQAADGLALHGTFYTAARRTGRAVLLLHEMCGNREAWAPFRDQLARDGIDALAVDLRGFGETGGKMEWRDEVADARAWLAWLLAQPGVERVGVLGESLGAKLTLTICAREPRCLVAAALSPYGSYTNSELNFTDRAVYLLGVRGDDVKSAQAVRRIASDVRGDVTLRLVAGIEPGIASVLDGDIVGEVVAWVDRHLAVAD